MTAVTRTEIAEHLAFAFDLGRLTRGEILAAARAADARADVITVLEALPERSYSTLRDLWHHLLTVPIST